MPKCDCEPCANDYPMPCERQPATPPEPAAPRDEPVVLSPETIAELYGDDAPEPACHLAQDEDDADRDAYRHAERWLGKLEDLRTLLRAAEARGRERGLEEAHAAAQECGGPCRRRLRALRGKP